MLKDTLLHMLFIGAVLFAASFLKKDHKNMTQEATTMTQTSGIVMDDETYPYTASSVSPVADTIKRK